MYAFVRPGLEGSPWDYWDKATLDVVVTQTNAFLGTDFNADTLHRDGLITNPDMSPAKANAYIDTIMAVTLPRQYLAMDLGDAIVKTEDLIPAVEVGLEVSPNPATDWIRFESNPDQPMQGITLFNVQGMMIKNISNLNSSQEILQRGDLKSGLYVAYVRFKEGVSSKKILIQ